jgi:mannose/fructose/N-acetylgalactosamine-specific phosphotransferase system component IIC
MHIFWSLFWKIFGAVLIVILCIAVGSGIVTHSAELTYTIVQRTLAIAMGICGFIGFVVVPVELYLEDRSQRRTPHDIR